MTIKQLTEIVNGSLTPSTKKLDASLVQISANPANKLSVASDGLLVSVPSIDLTPYYTSTQTESAISAAIAQAQLAGGEVEVDLSGYATKAEVAYYQTESQVNTLVETYISEVYDPDLNRNISNLLDVKADKTDLASYATVVSLSSKLDTPTETVASTVTTPKVNSIPLYTLNNNGGYVLCTPDSWLEINGMLIPAYKKTTVLGEE